MSKHYSLNLAFSLSICLFVSGCLFPKAPKPESFERVASYGELTVYHTKPKFNTEKMAYERKGKNVLYMAADEVSQVEFQKFIKKIYKKPVRLEELAWWEYNKLFRDKYDEIVFIPHNEVRYKNLMNAIQYLEHRGQDYDLFILTHGIPNHLTTGGEGYFLSYEELEKLAGRLHHLDLVFMQACFGDTLVQDWVNAGAKTVISFSGFNRNFFYLDFFLRWYRYYGPVEAHYKARSSMQWHMENELLYQKIMSAMGLSVDEYLTISESPTVSVAVPRQ